MEVWRKFLIILGVFFLITALAAVPGVVLANHGGTPEEEEEEWKEEERVREAIRKQTEEEEKWREKEKKRVEEEEKTEYHQVEKFIMSQDGKYAYYIVYGLDGSTSPPSYFAKEYYLNVPKNRFIGSAGDILRGYTDEDNDENTVLFELVENLQERSGEFLDAHKFSKDPVKLTKFTRDRNRLGKQRAFKHDGKTYKLSLKVRNYKVKWCGRSRTKIFTLKLSRGGKSKNLQRDRKLYRSRGCPFEYYLADGVYIQKGHIVVFVKAKKPSRIGVGNFYFKPLVVSGTLNFK